MEEIDATTARRELRTVLDRAYVHGEPTAVTRHGEIIAIVVPADWVEMDEAPEPGAPGKVALLQSAVARHVKSQG